MKRILAILTTVALSAAIANAQLVDSFTNTFTVGGADDAAFYTTINTNGSFTVTNTVPDGSFLDPASDGNGRIHRTSFDRATVGVSRGLGVIAADDVGLKIIVDADFRHHGGLTSEWNILLDGVSQAGDAQKKFSSFGSGTIAKDTDYLLSTTMGIDRGNGSLMYTILPGDVGKMAGVSTRVYDSSNNGTAEGSRDFSLDSLSFNLEQTVNDFVVYLSDDFETGTGELPMNGWMGGGPEPKEYNGTNYPGTLAFRDLNADEKNEGSGPHAGYWDTLTYNFEEGIALTDTNDWFQLDLDVGIFLDESGAGYYNGRGLRISFTDANAPSNAGFGFLLQTGTNSNWSQLHEFNSATGYGPSLDGASYVHPLDGTLAPLLMKVTKVAGGYDIEASWGGSAFDIGTVSNSLAEVFDTLTITVSSADIAFKIDNAYLVANVEPVPLTPYEAWAKLYIWDGGDSSSTGNPDGDALNNHGEYVFGGDPTIGTDVGFQPSFAPDGYVYTLRNDTSLNPLILTRDDLVNGDWATNDVADSIILDNENLTSYTNGVGTGAAKQFYKLIVE